MRKKALYNIGDYVYGDAGYAIIIDRTYVSAQDSYSGKGYWCYEIDYLETTLVDEDEICK